VRIKKIGAEAVSRAEPRPGVGHDLHQPHLTLGRGAAYDAGTFRLYDGGDLGCRNAEAQRGFRREPCKATPLRLDGRYTLVARLRRSSAACRQQHHYDRERYVTAKLVRSM
jgi:hypothetical protein